MAVARDLFRTIDGQLPPLGFQQTGVEIGEEMPTIIMGTGAADGDAAPFLSANKGSIYLRADTTDDYCPMALKMDEGGDDNDWVIPLIPTTYGSSASNYISWSTTSDTFATVKSATSQTTENNSLTVSLTTDSSYLSGTNMTWSSAYGSAALKISGTYSGTGGYSNIYSSITTTGAQTTDGHGVIGIKGVVTNTAALTDGELYGAQFIAKHNHATNTVGKSASLIGLEAWSYISAAGWAGTVIGANLGIHNECTGTYPTGSVHRAVQVFCDNNASANVPTESTGICIWNQAGAWDNVLNVVNSGDGFDYFVKFTDDGAPAQDSSSAVNNLGTKGWIKVLIGSSVRYISLGDGVS